MENFLRGVSLRKGTAWVLFVLVFAWLAVPGWGGDLGRLHPLLRGVLSQFEQDPGIRLESIARLNGAAALPGVLPPVGWGFELGGQVAVYGERLGVLVKTRHTVFGNSFLGLPVWVSTGTILGLRVSLEELAFLADCLDVIYVEPAWRTEPKLDRSVPAIGADVVHGRVPPVLGEGVIVGAVDTGIDYTHLDFRRDEDGDGFEETSRILYLWDQTAGFLGAYYTRQEIEADLRGRVGPGAGLVHETDEDGHGTHVLSVAAGDGSSSSLGLVGVAPAAELIMVKTSFYTSDILSGVRYIFDRAAGLGLPAVVNLSLGGHSGPHDGTSLFEQGLDELGRGPGRAIVVSAGNEGEDAIHVSGTLDGGSSAFSVNPRSGSFALELWYPGGSRFTVTVLGPGGAPLVVPSGTSATDGVSVDVDNATAGVNPLNGDRQILVTVRGLGTSAGWTFVVEDAGGGGRFDGWITSSGGETFVGGDAASTVDEPGNARGVITVGSFNTKGRWASLSGDEDFSSEYPIGALSGFSSRGPTRDGRQKPDVAAPGAWVAAARSASSSPGGYLVLPDGTHTMLAGTSVSAPHVAGVAALLLSINPEETGDEIKQRLIQTARSDSFTGAVPNPRWGFGKVAADAAVVPIEPPPDGHGDVPTVALTENPVTSHALFAYHVPAGARGATLRVFDFVGKLVFEAPLDPGDGEYDWGLEDRWGDPVASGLYLFVVVSETNRSAIGRLVIDR